MSVIETVQTKDDKILRFFRDWRSKSYSEAQKVCESSGMALLPLIDPLETTLFTSEYISRTLETQSSIDPCFVPTFGSGISYWNSSKTVCVGKECENWPYFICAEVLRQPITYKRVFSLRPGQVVPFVPTLFDLTLMSQSNQSSIAEIEFHALNQTRVERRTLQASSTDSQLKTFRNLDGNLRLSSRNFIGFEDIDFTRKFDLSIKTLPEESNLTLSIWIDHCPPSYRFVDGLCYPKRRFFFTKSARESVHDKITGTRHVLDEVSLSFETILPSLLTSYVDHLPLITIDNNDTLRVQVGLRSSGYGQVSIVLSNPNTNNTVEQISTKDLETAELLTTTNVELINPAEILQRSIGVQKQQIRIKTQRKRMCQSPETACLHSLQYFFGNHLLAMTDLLLKESSFDLNITMFKLFPDVTHDLVTTVSSATMTIDTSNAWFQGETFTDSDNFILNPVFTFKLQFSLSELQEVHQTKSSLQFFTFGLRKPFLGISSKNNGGKIMLSFTMQHKSIGSVSLENINKDTIEIEFSNLDVDNRFYSIIRVNEVEFIKNKNTKKMRQTVDALRIWPDVGYKLDLIDHITDNIAEIVKTTCEESSCDQNATCKVVDGQEGMASLKSEYNLYCINYM